ncbi:Cytidylate kinase [hydrothermal vent metagenome]|uniref:(d)CMP kinase n=1 Tax=hydrothermal vent metagenome TaxID=652676 RepID=A0A3B1BW06_9ZZZZ
MTHPYNCHDNFVVAIDGPAGSGKSTMAKLLAKEIDGVYVDTGAMYRAVTAYALNSSIDTSDEEAVSQMAKNIRIEFERDGNTQQKVFVNGVDFTARIREPDVNDHVSTVAAYPAVRRLMVTKQRAMGRHGRIVMEGRDIGTNVFPSARFKFFLTADDDIRADRRLKELGNAGHTVSKDGVLKNIQARDKKDSEREESPLLKAEGALEISTTDLTIDEVLQKMLKSLVSGS